MKGFVAGENIEEAMLVSLIDGKVYKATSGANVIGVTDYSVKTGKVVDVILSGIGEIQVEGSAVAGDAVVLKENGKAQAFSLDLFADTTVDTVVNIVGILLDGDSTGAYLPANITNTVVVVPKQKTE